MPVVLGIDGGGTQTTCAVANETSVLATATAGGSAMLRVPPDEARVNLRSAIAQACERAGVKLSDVEAAVVGVSGASVPKVVEDVRSTVRAVVNCDVQVVSDILIALEAAFRGGPGVVVVAGTGSIAYARNHAGQTARSGGWGRAISDEGSAYWIGRRAVAGALEDDEALLADILEAWKLSSREELIASANGLPSPNFADLFPLFVQGASRYASSLRISREAGEVLASLAEHVISRLWRTGEPVRVAVAGSVFQHANVIRKVFAEALRKRPGTEIKPMAPAVIEPVQGAVWLARARAERQVKPR